MKLSSTLLSAITLGVSLTAVTTATTSCEKKKIKQTIEQGRETENGQQCHPDECAACGMG
jgi:hypothetical protein